MSENLTPYIAVACKAFKNCLPGLTGQESVLIVTDDTNDPNQKELADIAGRAFSKLKHSTTDTVQKSKDFTKEEAANILAGYELIFNVSSHAHRGNIFDLLGRVGNPNTRIVLPIGATKEMFAPNGPLDKDFMELKETAGKLKALLNPAVGLRITTPYGTSLSLPLKEGRIWSNNLGIINPGSWDNMTGSEITTTPDEFESHGILILFGIDDILSRQQLSVDEPIEVKIDHGLITLIKGGKLAETLRNQLHECALIELQEGRNLLNVYRIAEIGLPVIPGQWQLKETPTVMIEKSILHIAFGDSQHGEGPADGIFKVNSHWDELVPNATITAYYAKSDFEHSRHGRQIMKNGRYTLHAPEV